MNTQHWSETLRLLCMMILVDEEVYEVEIEAFKDAAIALRDSVNPGLMLTRHMAADWFREHRDEIAVDVSSVYYESSVSKVLWGLSPLENKPELLSALIKVAMSDGRKHQSESKLLAAACDIWKLDKGLLL